MNDPRDVLNREVVRLRRFAYSLTGNLSDADDLVHDLAIKVLERGIPPHEDPVPWLITVCKNLWLDNIRRNRLRQQATESLIIGDDHEMHGDTTVAEVQLFQLVASLQLLPEDQRLTLSLVAIEGMSYSEAATLLDVPIGTVMSRVCRARAFLLEYVGANREFLL